MIKVVDAEEIFINRDLERFRDDVQSNNTSGLLLLLLASALIINCYDQEVIFIRKYVLE
jgi:hypothetical protein